jgi:hypothetical protein
MKHSRKERQGGRRRKRPRVVKELIRIGAGKAMLYVVAGTDRPVKLLREDVQKLEANAGKYVEEMYEKDLVSLMETLSIKSQPLTDDEQQMVRLASKYVLAGYFLLDSI